MGQPQKTSVDGLARKKRPTEAGLKFNRRKVLEVLKKG
ncbi:hypothetical protein SAMN05444358_11329 [Ruegeria halocynthiae]|uniref:Uncharacterized protein n=1 Tax=Ruegeria halocynthiae TaxID=985054 RepID=A0A1H3F3J3_9RHOB|nr:hypothetical protein SAMN05444358_11329 [Ruegeria halocynthiae]